MAWTGSCLCGSIRYRSYSDPIWVGHCHCRLCQRWTGAPAFTGACFDPDDFEWTNGQPSFYESSKGVRRSFCPNCSSPFAFHRGNVRVTVTAGTLDNPELLRPEFHMFSEHEHRWSIIHDRLPRQEGFLEDDQQFADPDLNQ